MRVFWHGGLEYSTKKQGAEEDGMKKKLKQKKMNLKFNMNSNHKVSSGDNCHADVIALILIATDSIPAVGLHDANVSGFTPACPPRVFDDHVSLS